MNDDLFDVEHLLEQRTQKDEVFRDALQSPLPAAVLTRFEGLHYYEPNDDFAVPAVLNRSSSLDTINMLTTTSELRQFIRFGVFKFSIGDKQEQLTAYGFIDGDKKSELFVPFKDATNGIDTYETGRYLTVALLDDDSSYVIDFNEAYNPYCAYNDAYSCPLVPKENVLLVPIEAGEKKWR